MKRGITVTNYLVDGDPEGIIFAYVSNWSGQAIKIPRNLFAEAKNLDEVIRPGVYFLIGQNENNPDDKLVYVGEANDISERLKAHVRDPEKSFFEVIVCFTSKDENLTVSHTKYLEQKIITHINTSSQYRLINRKDGNTISLSKMSRDEMESFYDNMKIILPTIGYSLLQEEHNHPAKNTTNTNSLFLKKGKIIATAQLTSNGIEVLKDSILNNKINDSLSGSYTNLRSTLLDKQIIGNSNGVLKFIQNYEFSSPSTAAALILGYSVNGRTAWKNANGESIKQMEEESL